MTSSKHPSPYEFPVRSRPSKEDYNSHFTLRPKSSRMNSYQTTSDSHSHSYSHNTTRRSHQYSADSSRRTAYGSSSSGSNQLHSLTSHRSSNTTVSDADSLKKPASSATSDTLFDDEGDADSLTGEEPPLGPPQLTEGSIAALIRLESRYQEVEEVIVLMMSFERVCGDTPTAPSLRRYYIEEVIRSCNSLSRDLYWAHFFRAEGLSTLEPTLIEKAAESLIEYLNAYGNTHTVTSSSSSRNDKELEDNSSKRKGKGVADLDLDGEEDEEKGGRGGRDSANIGSDRGDKQGRGREVREKEKEREAKMVAWTKEEEKKHVEGLTRYVKGIGAGLEKEREMGKGEARKREIGELKERLFREIKEGIQGEEEGGEI